MPRLGHLLAGAGLGMAGGVYLTVTGHFWAAVVFGIALAIAGVTIAGEPPRG